MKAAATLTIFVLVLVAACAEQPPEDNRAFVSLQEAQTAHNGVAKILAKKNAFFFGGPSEKLMPVPAGNPETTYGCYEPGCNYQCRRYGYYGGVCRGGQCMCYYYN